MVKINEIIGPVFNAFSPMTNIIMLVDPWQRVEGFAANTYGGRLSLLFAAFAAAAGYSGIVYAILLGKAVGPSGRLYALDVQKPMLDLVPSKAKQARLLNIAAMWADLESPHGSQLADETINLVLISNILFQSEHKLEMLSEAFRILAPGGKIAVIEWNSTAGGTGPPMDKIIKREAAEKLLTEAVFALEKEFYAGDNHYGLLYRKS